MLYDFLPPPEWSFAEYNRVREEKGKVLAKITGGDNTVVPYRQNRLVMFNSALFHKTDRLRFKKGYLNRRINLTFLFGDR